MKTLQHYNDNFYSVVVEPTITRCYASHPNIQVNRPVIANALKCLWQRDPDTNEIVCQWTAV